MVDESKGLADALRFTADLAEQGATSVEVITVDTVDMPGMPEQVQLIQHHGADARFESLRGLLEPWRQAPLRRAGTAKLDTLRSFIELVVRHKDADSAIFARAEWPEPWLMAVIDYHQHTGSPRFLGHRMTYAFPLTREFKTWMEMNCEEMKQADFAVFIEDNIADLCVAPEAVQTEFKERFHTEFAVPTDLVALAAGLEIHVKSKVKNRHRTSSGETAIEFSEEHQNAEGKPVVIPRLFMLCLPLFVGGGQIFLPALLRYRIDDGQILLRYQLYKWEDALRDRVIFDAAIVAEQTELPVFMGAPEA